MKKIAFLPLAAFAVTAACADFQGAVTPDELNIKAAAPNTAVSATFEVAGPEQTRHDYLDAPKNNQGSCNTTNGAWTNRGGTVSDPNHEQCTDITTIPGDPIDVTFSAVANYVQPNSGNLQLNFTGCGYIEDEDGNWIGDCDAKTYIHYNRRHDSRDAAGVLVGEGEDGSQWIIRLGQFGNGATTAKGLIPEEGDNRAEEGTVARSFTGLAEKVGSTETKSGVTFSW
jgi:hypothetical protein